MARANKTMSFALRNWFRLCWNAEGVQKHGLQEFFQKLLGSSIRKSLSKQCIDISLGYPCQQIQGRILPKRFFITVCLTVGGGTHTAIFCFWKHLISETRLNGVLRTCMVVVGDIIVPKCCDC